MSNQNNSAVNNRNQSSIMDTAVKIEPVAVVYNITNEEIENFVYTYLTQGKGIQGVQGVACRARKFGQSPDISIYAFLDTSSEDIISNMRDIPPHLRNKMDLGGIRLADRLANAVRPLSNELRCGLHDSESSAWVKLDIFRVLGSMLAADRRRHNIVITRADDLKKKSISISVVKEMAPVYSGDNRQGQGDRFGNMIRDIE